MFLSQGMELLGHMVNSMFGFLRSCLQKLHRFTFSPTRYRVLVSPYSHFHLGLDFGLLGVKFCISL